MRIVIVLFLILSACSANNEIEIVAVKEKTEYKIEKSLSVKSFISKIDSLKCHGYQVLGNKLNSSATNVSEYVFLSKCKTPKLSRIVCYSGIQLPVYKCKGFRKYGINLCEDDKIISEKLEEYYVNPRKREYYAFRPEDARFELIVDENNTISSVVTYIKKIKNIRDNIQNGKYSNIPLQIRIQTIQKDSVLITLPKEIKINVEE